jgi:TonB family protein
MRKSKLYEAIIDQLISVNKLKSNLIMKKLLTITFFIALSTVVNAQQIQKLHFGENILTGTVILKTLMHPLKETPIKNCLVFKLDKKVKFFAEPGTDESDLVTDEIRIYGSLTSKISPNITYQKLINKKVTIKAVIFFSASGQYPLAANMEEIIAYKIMQIEQTTGYKVSPKRVVSQKVDALKPSNDESDEIFTNVEVLPTFPGGLEQFGKFLGKNLRYPPIARESGIQGRVFCTFVVEKDGSLTDIKVSRGIGGGCDEEAIRVLRSSPKWNPGIQHGRPVRVSYTVPIFFQLQQ